MVSNTLARESRLNATFAALADPTRRAILTRLGEGGATVTELAEPFAISLPAVSKHLKILERAGLIDRSKQGRVHRLRLRAEPMRAAAEWMGDYRRFWERNLDNLDRFLQNEGAASRARRAKKKSQPSKRRR